MSSLQSLRELINERLAAAAEEIFRLCEGTIVQYEQELCRQRRLLDTSEPPLQLHHIDLPQHWLTEKEALCNHQKNFRVEQKNLEEPPQMLEEQEEPESPLLKEDQEEPELPWMKEEQEEPEPPLMMYGQKGLCVSQDEEQLELKQEPDTLMDAPLYEEKTYDCEEFNKRFRDPSSFQIHRTSTGEKPFTCKECHASFSVASSLNRHMKTHTEENPFSCKECNKNFSQTTHLKLHIRTHTGEKPFSCKECNKSFKDTYSFKIHMRSHTGEKPFTCIECRTSFTVASSLNRHMRIHTGEKPFSCNECEKSFHYMFSLKKHMNTHTRKFYF